MRIFPRPAKRARRSSLAPAGAVVLSVFLLTGCVQPTPAKTPKAQATVKPLFASDADALAAATKAYAAYLKMSDQVSQEGGLNPARLSPLVTTNWLKQEVASANSFADSGLRQSGATHFDSARLQHYDRASPSQTIDVYLCLDVSEVHILDAEDTDTTKPSAQTKYSFVASFVTDGHQSLLLDDNSPWTGASFC
ncbi:hypothetical protein [Parafrigoribacterium soli]|uniref:hypothetical protein n=1 Tax=Parafrigoribacterium soli TaxID=3144663 RepID=UPI0032ED1363